MSDVLEQIEVVQAGDLKAGDYMPEHGKEVGGIRPHPGGKILVVLLSSDKTRTPKKFGLREQVKVIRKANRNRKR